MRAIAVLFAIGLPAAARAEFTGGVSLTGGPVWSQGDVTPGVGLRGRIGASPTDHGQARVGIQLAGSVVRTWFHQDGSNGATYNSYSWTSTFAGLGAGPQLFWGRVALSGTVGFATAWNSTYVGYPTYYNDTSNHSGLFVEGLLSVALVEHVAIDAIVTRWVIDESSGSATSLTGGIGLSF